MEIAITAPTALLRGVCNSDTSNFYMCHTHRILNDKAYAEFYKSISQDTTNVVILNSSRARNVNWYMPTSTIINACRIITPTELILPDVFQRGPETMASAKAFVEQTSTGGPNLLWSKNFAVPQGRNRKEWLECFDYFNTLDHINTIGLSRTLDDIWYPGGRIGASLFLKATGRVNIREKEYHALDVYDPLEVLSLATLGWIRSFDTTLPIDAGLQGIQFDRVPSFPMKQTTRRQKHFDVSESECFAALDTIKHNISVLQEWCTPKEKQLNE